MISSNLLQNFYFTVSYLIEINILKMKAKPQTSNSIIILVEQRPINPFKKTLQT